MATTMAVRGVAAMITLAHGSQLLCTTLSLPCPFEHPPSQLFCKWSHLKSIVMSHSTTPALCPLSQSSTHPQTCKCCMARTLSRDTRKTCEDHDVAEAPLVVCMSTYAPNHARLCGRCKLLRLQFQRAPHRHPSSHSPSSTPTTRSVRLPGVTQDLKEGFSLFDKKGDSKIAAKVSSALHSVGCGGDWGGRARGVGGP